MAILSYSAYSKYKKCPEMYRLEYVAHVKPEIKQNVRPFLEGAMVAKAVEIALKKRPLDIKSAHLIAPQIFRLVLEEQKAKGVVKFNRGESFESILKKAGELFDASLHLIKTYHLDLEDTYNEYWFGTYKKPLNILPGLDMQGAADFLKIKNETFDLYDLKTSKDTTYLDIDQLWFYLLAAEKKFGKKPERIAFLLVRKATMYYLTTDDKNRQVVTDRLVDTASKINTGEYIPTPSEKVCGDCLYNLQCKSAMKGYSTSKVLDFGELLDGKVN